MSEHWDFAPDWRLGANGKEVVGKIHTQGDDSEFAYSSMSLKRAAEVQAQLRAMGDRYEVDGPVVLGWALKWMADDLQEVLDEAEKAASQTAAEVT